MSFVLVISFQQICWCQHYPLFGFLFSAQLLTSLLLPQFIVAVTVKYKPVSISGHQASTLRWPFISVFCWTREICIQNVSLSPVCIFIKWSTFPFRRTERSSLVNTLIIKSEHLLKLLLILCIFCWSTFFFFRGPFYLLNIYDWVEL